MTRLLLENAEVLVTMDRERREIENGAVLIDGNRIEAVGGSLEPGKAADLVAYRVDGLQHAGAGADRVAGLLTCAPANAWFSIIDGQPLIEQGRISGLDMSALVQQHNAQSARLMRRAARQGN